MQNFMPGSFSKLVEAAFRNLHMDCYCAAPDGREFSSRMLTWHDGQLLAGLPRVAGKPISLAKGQEIICSCKLGQEVLRFSATVDAQKEGDQARGDKENYLLLSVKTEPQVVQRRRYYRVSISSKQPSQVTCWVVNEDGRDGQAQCEALQGEVIDLSSGGIGILLNAPGLLEQTESSQLWVRFTVPGENESLIFRAAIRHASPTGPDQWRLGLEFLEYVEPGQHREVVDRLARFAAKEMG